MTSLDFNAAATKLFGDAVSKPSPSSSAATEALDFADAGRRVYGESTPTPDAPAVRDTLDGISVYGDRASWNEEIERSFTGDLDTAKRLAAVGLAADSDDPAAARAAIAQGGVSPARFRELVAIGRRVAEGGR